jgi:hypothetical protein
MEENIPLFHIETQGAYKPFSSMGLGKHSQVSNGGLERYYVEPSTSLKSWKGDYNACGMTAFVTLLRLYGKFNGVNAHSKIEGYWKNGSTGPDILGGALGTSWQRIRDNFHREGLRTVSGNEDRATVSMGDGKWEWLKGWVTNGYPVAATISIKPIEGVDGGHWVIVREISGDNVYLENYGAGQKKVSKDIFLKAWEAYSIGHLPWTHYASVVPFQ